MNGEKHNERTLTIRRQVAFTVPSDPVVDLSLGTVLCLEFLGGDLDVQRLADLILATVGWIVDHS